MSLDASGSVASTITFSKWKGRNYVRQLTIPANPQTAGQNSVRKILGKIAKAATAVLTSAADELHEGSAFFQAARDNAPSGQSWISFLQSTLYAVDSTVTAGFAALSGTEQGYFTAAAATVGLTTYTPPAPGASTVSAGLQLYELAYFAQYTLDAGIIADFANPTEGEVNDMAAYVHTTTGS